jgi:hypothetical protein
VLLFIHKHQENIKGYIFVLIWLYMYDDDDSHYIQIYARRNNAQYIYLLHM